MARKKPVNNLTINLNLTDKGDTPPLQAYVFSSGGKALGSIPIQPSKPVKIPMPRQMDGRGIEVLLGPAPTENDPSPSVAALKRAGAYALPGTYLRERPVIDIRIPGTILPLWCACPVNGRVINRVDLPDGSVEEMPVCNARVHICEVDPWVRILPRIPDPLIFKLRDDLLDIIEQRDPPIPIPDPGPRFDRAPSLRVKQPLSRVSNNLDNRLKTINRPLEIDSGFAFKALSATNSAIELRRQLIQTGAILFPYWCLFPYIWPFYRKDCITTVDVDSNGRFSTTIFFDCKDQPDLYFWVEQLQDGVWTTVYKPPVACNTHWNYVCGTEVVINAPNAEPCEVPDYDIPDGVTLFVLPLKIGRTSIWGTPAGAPAAPIGWLRSDGMVDYSPSGLGMVHDAPFGGGLHFYHDDSYFIPKPDTRPGIADNSIKYYRYSYRRSGSSGWTHMTAPQARIYRMEYNDGNLPTYESYPIQSQTIGGNANLFEFKPRTPPERPIDPPTVVAREWLTGNLGDVAASWNTQVTAPGISDSNLLDRSGVFEVKVEVFNKLGQLVMPGGSTFEFLARNSDGTTTRVAETAEIDNGGFVFKVHIDNNPVTSDLPQPSIGGIQASDDCGFLRYDNASDLVHVEFTATHPNDHAVFDFTIKRGSNPLASASTPGVFTGSSVISDPPFTEVSVISAPPYNLVGGSYQNDFPATALVGACINAAFAADLHIWGKATNGYHRLGYDSRELIAFALAETEEDA